MKHSHQYYMQAALLEAHKALQKKEVPIGAVLVNEEGHIVAQAHNLRESKPCATAHAELLAIEQACLALKKWRLTGCTLYVTLEPCFMCAGAIILSRIACVVYGATDPKAGAVESLSSLLNDSRLNHQCEVISGVRQNECSKLLKDFFKAKRNHKDKTSSRH